MRWALFGWAHLENIAATEIAGGEDGVGEAADGTLAAGLLRNEAVSGYMSEDFGSGVGGAGTETGDFHGEEVVDVVAEEAGLGQRDVELGGEVAEGGGFIAGAFGDEGDVHLFGVEIDEW